MGEKKISEPLENTTAEALKNDYSVSIVPESQRKSLVNNAAVWYGFTVSISAFLTGGTLGDGLTASRGILAVLIGNAVLIVIACLLGIIGQRTGLTTASLGRIVFGKTGSIISSLVLGLPLMHCCLSSLPLLQF